ncbi:MAG TPA: Co2+/Mg2+ efflux protein ApaG [Bacteroidota bacterium]|nr:Co2+/Mg2+ efflux protein ApaG [Bacteroidota bacterium]
MTSYAAVTHDIKVTVRPVYLDGQSEALSRKFVFAYFIRIENLGADSVQLLRRHWIIKHSSGKTEEVEGEGVIGKQPVINPGHSHEYNSYCILETMEGSMEGYYLMQRSNGEQFSVIIPLFSLRALAN